MDVIACFKEIFFGRMSTFFPDRDFFFEVIDLRDACRPVDVSS